MPGGQLGKRGSNVGKLRQQLQIQSPNPSATRNEFGQRVQSQEGFWVDGSIIWGAVEPIVGTKFMASDKVQANVTHMIVTRHRTDINEQSRLIWLYNGNNAVFNVLAVKARVGESNYLEIWAKEQKF